jgi:hypothetical protein
VLVILAGLYAVRANHQIGRRMEARITGVDLARDPVLRRQQVAGRALASIAEGIDADTRRIVVLSPVGGGRVFGVRSGEEVRGGTGGREPYDLLRESIDHGRAVRLFHPRIDSVAFIAEWAHVYRDFDVFMPYQDGHLLGVGRGPRGLERAASWMMEQGWPGQARDHLGRAVAAYPDDRELRFSFARSLAASGDQAGAVGELTRLIEESPRDSLSTVAREVLRARPARAPDAGRPAMGKRTRSADTAR